ncbi:MAG: ATP phosphoribosyltransferase regulatory subunit [Gammaproteobacteria bacterium]|nr:MAG: ATP phosphoribosyltransferase regulatory subunit [Gammaproteobacteria bacterium]
MKNQNSWILPEGIEEILPPRAGQLDKLCREIIDLYASWGYQLVIPPMIEYMDSLLTGTGKDLDLQIFKLTDQMSGRLMGVRADTTPQVARIDAHNLKREVPTRLCYLGTVLHTRPEYTGGNRSPLQVGAELYGHKGFESDAEVLCLMIETINKAGVEKIHVDLGHVGIYNKLVQLAKLDDELEAELFDTLQRKAMPELDDMISAGSLSAEAGQMFKALITSNGSINDFKEARVFFDGIDSEIRECLDELQNIIEFIGKRMPEVVLNFDFSELRGYHYHTGIVFTAYAPGHGQGIAFGGRYDDIGSAFGRARPATGFSTDIKTLLGLSTLALENSMGIYAPCSDEVGQLEAINNLRNQGEIVICELPGQSDAPEEMGCDRQLEYKDGQWTVVPQ